MNKRSNAVVTQTRRNKRRERIESDSMKNLSLRQKKSNANTLQVLSYIRLTLIVLWNRVSLGRQCLVAAYRTTIKSVRSVKKISTESTCSFGSIIFLNVPTMQYYFGLWSPQITSV
jgi:hypothetical protein